MEPSKILKVAVRWWWLAAIPVLVVLAHVLMTYQRPATAYQVVLRFTTGGQPSEALSDDYDRYYAWLASEYIANGLADLARTGTFAQDVADRLSLDGLAVTPQAIQAAVATDNAQSVLVVYLTWSDPSQGSQVATAIGDALIEAGPDYFPQMDGVGPVAKLADPPAPIALPPSLQSQLLGPGLRVLLGLAIGAGLVLAAHAADPVVRETTDLAALGIHIVGAVPRADNRRWRLR